MSNEIRDRLQTILDEAFGPYPEMGLPALFDELEKRIYVASDEIRHLRIVAGELLKWHDKELPKMKLYLTLGPLCRLFLPESKWKPCGEIVKRLRAELAKEESGGR